MNITLKFNQTIIIHRPISSSTKLAILSSRMLPISPNGLPMMDWNSYSPILAPSSSLQCSRMESIPVVWL